MHYIMILTLSLIISGIANADAIVDFGGDYVTADSDSGRNVSDRDADLDADGKVNDSVRAITFLDHTKPLSPTEGTNGFPGGGRSAAMYGGIQIQKYGTTGPNGLAKVTIVDGGASDLLRLYFQRPPANSSATGSGVILWQMQDFTNGPDNNVAVALKQIQRFTVTLGAGNSFDSGRWVIRTGGEAGRYYISEAQIPSRSGEFQLDPSKTKWSVYTPTKQDMSFAADDFDKTLPPDDTVRAAGLFISARLAGDNRSAQASIARFQVHKAAE